MYVHAYMCVSSNAVNFHAKNSIRKNDGMYNEYKMKIPLYFLTMAHF